MKYPDRTVSYKAMIYNAVTNMLYGIGAGQK
jgi:hypothetical protein